MLEIIICSKNIRIGLYITNIISLGLGGADSYGIEKVIVPAERIEMYRWRISFTFGGPNVCNEDDS